MIRVGRQCEHFQRDQGQHGGEKMIFLRRCRAGGGSFSGHLVLQRLMKRFDRPSSVREMGELLVGQGGIAGHQREYPRPPVVVGQDVLGEENGTSHALRIDQTEFGGVPLQGGDLHKPPCQLVGFRQGDRTIDLHRADNMFFVGFDQKFGLVCLEDA